MKDDVICVARYSQVGHGTIGLRELPIVIWPLVGFKKWHKDARGGKQAEAHYTEDCSSDVGRDECGNGREGSSAVHGFFPISPVPS